MPACRIETGWRSGGSGRRPAGPPLVLWKEEDQTIMSMTTSHRRAMIYIKCDSPSRSTDDSRVRDHHVRNSHNRVQNRRWGSAISKYGSLSRRLSIP
jgi:hypothetical protein